jgi:hypothetical protein
LKVRCDEHVSPIIVAAISDLALSPGWEISSVLNVGHGGDADEHWITKFASDGGHAILTADRDFLSLAPQVNAVFDTGLKVIHLPPKWGQAKGHLQAAHILQWWLRIEQKIAEMKPRECYRPEWNIRETGEIKKIPIDFHKAQKQRRQQRREKSD